MALKCRTLTILRCSWIQFIELYWTSMYGKTRRFHMSNMTKSSDEAWAVDAITSSWLQNSLPWMHPGTACFTNASELEDVMSNVIWDMTYVYIPLGLKQAQVYGLLWALKDSALWHLLLARTSDNLYGCPTLNKEEKCADRWETCIVYELQDLLMSLSSSKITRSRNKWLMLSLQEPSQPSRQKAKQALAVSKATSIISISSGDSGGDGAQEEEEEEEEEEDWEDDFHDEDWKPARKAYKIHHLKTLKPDFAGDREAETCIPRESHKSHTSASQQEGETRIHSAASAKSSKVVKPAHIDLPSGWQFFVFVVRVFHLLWSIMGKLGCIIVLYCCFSFYGLLSPADC